MIGYRSNIKFQEPVPNLVIQCAVCAKPVGSMAVWYDPGRRERIFTVECHGQKDECRLPDYLFAEGPTVILSAVAFQPKSMISA